LLSSRRCPMAASLSMDLRERIVAAYEQ